jgi:hypothetical protein
MAASAAQVPRLIGVNGLPIRHAQDHHDTIHAAQHATAIYWQQRRRGRSWTKVRPGDPIPISSKGRPQQDSYVTVNEFAAWRLVRHTAALRAVYVDIDNNQDLPGVLEAVHDSQLPEPSYVVSSGNGLHLYWLIERAGPECLGLWRAVIGKLTQALKPVGADPVAKDVTRLLRVPGTINSKNGAKVEGFILDPEPWPIEELAEEVIGRRTAATVRDIRPKQKGKPQRRTGGHRTIYQWWHQVYRDLLAVHDHHWFGGVEDGYRDRWLFLTSVALSWFTEPASLEREIAATARSFVPTLTESESRAYTQTIRSKATEAANGEKVYWQGTPRDPRYWFRAQTLYEWLDDLIDDELQPKLRAIAPDSVLRERKFARDRQRWADHNTGQGYRQSQAERVALAAKLYREGWTQAQIAAHIGVTQQSISNWLKRNPTY